MGVAGGGYIIPLSSSRSHPLFHCAGREGVTKRVKCKMPQTGQIEYLIVVILERAWRNIISDRICYNETTVDVILTSHKCVLLLDSLPRKQILHHKRKQWNAALRVLAAQLFPFEVRLRR